VFCPKCGAVLVEHEGSLTCVPGSMPLSPRMREFLADTFIDRTRTWEIKPASFRWGGRWFCPADGAEMVEADGIVRCPTCMTAFPGPLLYQLIERHAHRRD